MHTPAPLTITLDLAAAAQTQLHRTVELEQSYEPEVFALLLSLLERDGKTFFVNVGSNIGLFALAAARLRDLARPHLQVCAHEPLPMLQVRARALMAANSTRYELSAQALSDQAGIADFYVSARSDASNSLKQGFRPAKEVIRVEVETLDRLYLEALRSYDNVVLMIDVETAEPDVLRGAAGVLEIQRPLVICEVLAGRTEQPLSTLFAKHRYVSYRFDSGQWSRQQTIVGDASHKHRDWFFCPVEQSQRFGPSFAAFPAARVVLRA